MHDLMLWIGAVTPIVLLFLLIGVVQMKTERAAFLGVLASVLGAWVIGRDTVKGILVSSAKGAWNAFPILLVIWTAILLYQMLDQTKAFLRIRAFVSGITKDQLVLILLFSWIFSSFLQGITGFGVPVAVCAPLLMAVGVQAPWAVVITLLGHAWANTFGTFAMGWDALTTQSGIIDPFMTLCMTCLFLAMVDFVGATTTCLLYGGKRAIVHMMPFLVIISTIHGLGQFLAGSANTTIAAFLPTTAALLAAFLLLKCGRYTKEWKLPSKIMREESEERKSIEEPLISVGSALLPFGLLVVLSVGILMIKPVYQVLSGPVLALSFPKTMTGRGFVNDAVEAYGTLRIFTHAGFILFLTDCITGIVYFREKLLERQALHRIGKATLKKIVPTSFGLLFLVMMAQILKGSGLMTMIAEGAAGVAGQNYGLLAPLIGVLGAFVTSSNTSSNILLGGFQAEMAVILGIPAWKFLAAQTVGGAIGTIIGPSTIFLGITTAGCQGKEGWVLKKMLPIAVAEAAVVGMISWILVRGFAG